MHFVHWPSLAMLVIAAMLFGGYALLRQESETLRAEIGFLEREHRQLDDLQAENGRLQTSRIPDAELQRLRNDRAALVRLRAEIVQLEESANRLSRVAHEPAAEPRAPLMLNVMIKAGGGLEVEGMPVDEDALRQLFARFARAAEIVEVRFGANPLEVPRAQMTDALTKVTRLGKEAGLRMSVRFPTMGLGGK